MKRLTTAIIYLACFLSTEAAPGPGKDVAIILNNSSLATTGAVRFQFRNLIAGMEDEDSILIIFDRYDHTGAGVVYKVYAADKNQGITVPAIPVGKYYVTVQCIGLHRDRIDKIVTIQSQKSKTVKISLTSSEVYSKTSVVIPAFHPNPSDLVVVRFK